MTRRDLRLSIAALLSSLFVIHAQAAIVFYIATNGNDSWSGHHPTAFKSQQNGPLATLEEAVRRSRLERKTPAHVEIFLRSGIHVVAEPIILTADDSDMTIAAYKDESATVSGQSVIEQLDASHWQHESLAREGFRRKTKAMELSRIVREQSSQATRTHAE